MKKLLPACLGLSLVFFTSASQAQTTVSLTPVQDNTLFESATGSTSGGADDNVFVGNTNNGGTRRAVLKFNLATIPAGATITGASLTLTMNQTISGAQPVALHRLSANWGEGTSVTGGGGGGGAPATTNSATWLHTFYPGTTWATAGGDYIATASATTSVSGNGNYTWTGPQVLADVQNMYAAATNNHGWILIGNEVNNGSAKRFGSREQGNPANRPSLSVTYTLPCNAPTVPTLSVSQTSNCPGGITNITATGNLNSATAWHLYSGTCGGTAVASNTTGIFSVSPAATTTYYVRGQGGCVTPGSCAQTTVTIQSAQSAAFSYSASSFCQSAANPTAAITGNPGGTFSSTPTGLSLNTSTGQINLGASTPGTYSVSYTTPGPCPATSSVSVTVNAAQSAAFSYSSATYCLNATNPTPVVTGNAGGTFSGTAGLVINAATGQINLAASTAGTHTVTYTNSGACATSATATVTLTVQQNAAFSYGAPSYCAGGPNAVPTITGTSGGTFSQAGIGIGLFMSAGSGMIDMSLTMPGTYQINYTTPGPCPATSTVSVTVNAAQSAAFSYSSSSYCQDAPNPSPTITGTTGGTFTGTTGLVVNAATGQINLAASTAGTHTLTYTTAGPCAATSTATLTLVQPENAAFSYSGTSFCQNSANPTPSVSGTPGGTFTASASGLVLNSTTGQINLAASSPGSYSVTYTTPGAQCGASVTVPVAITALGNAAFQYAAASFCLGGTNPSPTITGTSGGTFTGSTGLVINAATGQIDLSASTAGTHTVTYATTGACPAAATATVTLNATENAAFSYGGTTFCQNGPNAIAVITGTPGGTFSHGIGIGFFLNAATGEIDLSLTMPGTYQVTYTTPGACAASSSVTVVVNPTYTETASAVICNGDSYTFGSQTLTMAGTYTETFTAVAGCDSVVTLSLTVNTVNTGVTLNGQTLTANQAGAAYQWYNCATSTPIAGATAQSFTPTVTGQYNVEVTQNTCSEFSTCLPVTVTSAEEDLAQAVNLYPNPALNKVVLDLPFAANLEVELVSLLGQRAAWHSFTAANRAEIPVSHLAAGLYLVKIKAGETSITRMLQVVK